MYNLHIKPHLDKIFSNLSKKTRKDHQISSNASMVIKNNLSFVSIPDVVEVSSKNESVEENQEFDAGWENQSLNRTSSGHCAIH